ncbi:hypothetical protein ACP70R_006178 [Stipagrostis hirtigluma subsp. patula]
MKDLKFLLNQAQRVRLEAALHDLMALAPAAASAVAVGDTIPVNNKDCILKGHETLDQDGEVVAKRCGVVEWVDNLVYVRILEARYNKPEVGDIIVGRVIEITLEHWSLEINFRHDAILMLSSMNLPDGIQKKRTAVDELNMRSILEENDVVCLEVIRGVQHGGSPHLQAWGQKNGKLERGQLLMVPAYLVKRRKQHFHHLEQYDVDLILGCNGFIWIGEHVAVGEKTKLMGDHHEISTEAANFNPLERRNHICRLANAVRVLSALGFTLTAELIIETVEASSSSDIAINDMLGAEFFVQTAEREAKRRTDLVRKIDRARSC